MITKEQVLKVQEKWGQGVVEIGKLQGDRSQCESFTKDFINDRYSYQNGPVVFKPTKCAIEQFRPTKEEAISYFIAGEDRKCEEDKGFALQPWTKVRFENAGIILEEKRAIAMGNYYFTDVNGDEAKVEYTFGYKLENGDLKIDVHHSSFPYSLEANV